MSDQRGFAMISKPPMWLVILGVFWSTGALADEVRLTAEEILELLPGSRMVEENPPRGGGSVSVEWRSDGRVSARMEEGYSDTGKWWLDGNRYCRRWDHWADHKTTCWTFALDGSTLSWYDDKGEKVGSGELIE